MIAVLPELVVALDEFAANIDRIAAAARDHGARPVFLTQPTLWRDDLPPELRELLWCGGVGSYFGGRDADYYTVEALAEGMRSYNERLSDR